MAEKTSKVLIENSFGKELSGFVLSHPEASWHVLLDENSLKHCYPWLLHFLPQHHIIQVKSGEENKTLSGCEAIWKKLTETNADRKGILINLGGGMITDMGGFAAGCYKRGIRFINIPTTLLAMVDARVGAKTGIDFMGFKNQIGLFYEPEAVFIYSDFLKTLPERELVSGFAEIIKHYLVADKKEFQQLATSHPPFTAFNWDDVIRRNVKIKNDIVESDPHEQHNRKSLNFGHTIGHGVESYFLKDEKQRLLHGEAVAVGMLTEGFISYKKELISENELKSITLTIRNYFPLQAIPKDAEKGIIELMRQDKKNIGRQFQFTLLRGIGNYSINNAVEDKLIIESIEYYNRLLNEPA